MPYSRVLCAVLSSTLCRTLGYSVPYSRVLYAVLRGTLGVPTLRNAAGASRGTQAHTLRRDRGCSTAADLCAETNRRGYSRVTLWGAQLLPAHELRDLGEGRAQLLRQLRVYRSHLSTREGTRSTPQAGSESTRRSTPRVPAPSHERGLSVAVQIWANMPRGRRLKWYSQVPSKYSRRTLAGTFAGTLERRWHLVARRGHAGLELREPAGERRVGRCRV